MERAPHIESDARRDDGFTLVELLIVIVVLGVLAVVTVLAVRGITDRSQENAESTDLRNIETGIAAYWVEYEANPTEAELVAGRYLSAESDLHDIVVAADGSYTIVNVRTSSTVGSGAGSPTVTTTPVTTTPVTTTPVTDPPVTDPPVTDPPVTTLPPAVGPLGWLGTPVTVAGLPAVSYGDGSLVELQIAGATIRSSWNAMVTAGDPTPGGRTYVVVDASLITTPEQARALATAALGYDDFDAYTVDDTAALENPAFGSYGCVYDFLAEAPDVTRRPDRLSGTVVR